MCTLIVTIRTVLWYVMSLAATLMILVALFTNKWLEGHVEMSNFNSAEGILDTAVGIGTSVLDGEVGDALDNRVGLFLKCKPPEGKPFFEGECIPDWKNVEAMFKELDDASYPHAWRGSVICFVFGLLVMIITDLFALLTICCRRCVCCSVFTICGSLQSFASILFTLGLIAYPAGWGSQVVTDQYCGGDSAPFMLGDVCKLGDGFWLALAGTVCTIFSSSLAIWAYQSTRSQKSEELQSQGERYICLP